MLTIFSVSNSYLVYIKYVNLYYIHKWQFSLTLDSDATMDVSYDGDTHDSAVYNL